MLRALLVLLALVALTACAPKEVWAPDDVVARAAYSEPGPPTITVFTVLSNRSNAGEHSGLLIKGSQTVMFDPAGTWHHRALPERNDVFYGVTPKMVSYYIDYHARETYRVRKQVIQVTPEQAAIAMQRAMAYGPVPKARCAWATSSILQGVPGFESISQTLGPKKLANQVAKLPGLIEDVEITDDDADKNHGVLMVQQEDVERF